MTDTYGTGAPEASTRPARDKLKEALGLLVTAARHNDTPATITTQLGEAVALIMEVLDETT